MAIMGSKKKEIRGWRLSSSIVQGGQKVTVMNGSLQLEALAQVKGGSHVVSEDGVLRVRIVVKKQDLKKVLEVMRGGKSSTSTHVHHLPLFLPEQRLNLLLRNCRSSWRPELFGIPEEL